MSFRLDIPSAIAAATRRSTPDMPLLNRARIGLSNGIKTIYVRSDSEYEDNFLRQCTHCRIFSGEMRLLRLGQPARRFATEGNGKLRWALFEKLF